MIHAIMLLAGIIQAVPAEKTKPGPDVRSGSFCLFVALQAIGKGPTTHLELEEALGLPGPGGYSVHQLKDVAERFGVRTTAVETSLENLRHRRRRESFACLTLINSDHFVLVKDVDETRVSLIDPPRSFQLSADAFLATWTGKALLIGASPLQSEESVKWNRLLIESRPRIGIVSGFLTLAAVSWGMLARFRRARHVVDAQPLIFLGLLIPTITVLGGCNQSCRDDEGSLASTRSWLTISEEHKDLGTILQGWR